MEGNNLVLAIGLALFAGLSTGIGGLFTILFKSTNKKLLSYALGLSAGVMIYVSFVELFAQSGDLLAAEYGPNLGGVINVASFFGGMLLIAIIDKLIPSYENPHEAITIEDLDSCDPKHSDRKLLRVGAVTALVIAAHNFPEGIATFISAMQNPATGIPIAFAVAIHNIPEGIAIAVPVHCATGSKRKAVAMSFASGLTEPLGAIAAYFILMPYLNDTLFGILFAGIAGIMVFISFDELLPTAREYGEHHISIYGLITGMAIMALSLILVF